MRITFIISFALGTLVILAMFVQSRKRKGIRPFEITDKDKAQFKEMRREFGIRKLLVGFIGGLGALFCLSGITYPLYADSNPDLGWRDAFRCLAFGAFLVFCAWLLTRRLNKN